MPELPEVEALCHLMTMHSDGRRIDAVRLRSFAALKTFDPPLDALLGRTVSTWSRRGKFLLADTDGVWLGIHLGRAGWVRRREQVGKTAATSGRGPLALTVAFDDGTGFDVTEQGTEKRLAIYVVRAPENIEGVARLGIDPLDPQLDAGALGALLGAQPGQLKSVLTNQGVIAGIGNAYSDEILHASRLSPFRRASSLDANENRALHEAMVRVLGEAVHRAADVAAADLKAEKRAGMAVHGRTGKPCPVCGDTVREVSLATRSFQYCPTCQTGGKQLSDRRLSRLLK